MWGKGGEDFLQKGLSSLPSYFFPLKKLRYSLWLFHLHSTVKIQPFSPVFLLAKYRTKAFFRLSLWSFKEKSINHFLWHSLFHLAHDRGPPGSRPFGVRALL